MSWLDDVSGSRILRGVFGSDEVSPAGWRLLELHVERNVVRGVVDLDQFPSTAPRKWLARGADTVHATIWFNSLDRLAIEGVLRPTTTVELDQRPVEGADVQISLAGDGLSVGANRSQGLIFTKVEAARREDPPRRRTEGAPDRVPDTDLGVWLPGVRGGRQVVESFAPQPAPPGPGALRFVSLFPAQSALTLRYDLGDYPLHTPGGWQEGWNTMSVVLRCDTVGSVTAEVCSGTPWEMSAETTVVVTERGVLTSVRGDAVRLDASSASTSVDRVSGHLHGPDEE